MRTQPVCFGDGVWAPGGWGQAAHARPEARGHVRKPSGRNGNTRCRSICHGQVGDLGTTCLKNAKEKECGLERIRNRSQALGNLRQEVEGGDGREPD